jgi:hypothetical protein
MIAGMLALSGCGGGGGGSGSSSSGSSGGPPPPPAATAPTITGPAAALPAATAGTPGATSFTATGTAPITFAISAGALPEGMTLDATTGAYSGTLLVIGNFAFTVSATNSAGSATAQFTQTVNPAIPNANVLFSGNRLASFNTTVPTAMEAPVTLAGMLQGEELVAIARRPTNGFLYGVSVDGAGRTNLYAIHPARGLATALWESLGYVTDNGVTPNPIVGTRFGAHVSASSDVLRVINDTGQNFRFNLETGMRHDADALTANAQMDGSINGPSSRADSMLYTDNLLGASSVALYAIDSAIDSMCMISSPLSGTLTDCVPLSRLVDAVFGFDIVPGINGATPGEPVTSGMATAIIRLAGQTAERLATIDLTDGTVSAQTSPIASGIRSLALQSPPGIPMFALSLDGTRMLLFSSNDPATVVTRNITGVAAGETMVALEFRAHTGRLFGLAVNGTANTGTLYNISQQNGTTTTPLPSGIALVDDAGVTRDLPLASGGYAMDFNPTSDRIRVVASNDLNFRVSPATGLPSDANPNVAGLQADPNITPSSANVAEIAHTNAMDVDGEISTLYAIDAVAGQLCIQVPNAGTLSSCLPLTLNGAPMPLSQRRGFDIPGNVRAPAADAAVVSGIGYMAATGSVTGTTHLYEVNLASGALTDRGPIGDGTVQVSGLTVGLSTVR